MLLELVCQHLIRAGPVTVAPRLITAKAGATCPNPALDKCTCRQTQIGGDTLTFTCSNTLNDAAMDAALDSIPIKNIVDTLVLSGNGLTKVPTGLPTKFPKLISLNLANNQITRVNENELTLAGSVTLIDLSGNLITTIAPGSLPGKIIQ